MTTSARPLELVLQGAVHDMHKQQAAARVPLIGQPLADALARQMVARLSGEGEIELIYWILGTIGGPATPFEAMACMDHPGGRMQ